MTSRINTLCLSKQLHSGWQSGEPKRHVCLKDASLRHSTTVCARARGKEIQGTEQRAKEGSEDSMEIQYTRTVASKLGEEKTDCSIKVWGTIVSLENNTVGTPDSCHICNLSSLTDYLLKFPHQQFLGVSNYPSVPFQQSEIPTITLTTPVKILPSLSCLSDSNLIFLFLHSCSQAAKYLYQEHTDRLVSL